MNRRAVVSVLALLLVVVGGAWWYATKIYIPPFAINSADHIVSWSFKGAYSSNATLEAQAQADIIHLKSLIGGGAYPDYELYIGLASDYELLGDGRNSYTYLNKAIHANAVHGLVYVNLGHLMDELGAYNTARAAYAKAVALEPGMIVYQEDRLLFLTIRFPKDIAGDTAAFAEATKQFGVDVDILQIEAPWLAATGHITDAIKAWEAVRALSSSNRWPAIDAEIARLKARLAP